MRYGRRADERPCSDPLLLIARDATENDPTIDLRDTPEGVWITAELPDCSLDDVRVTANGISLRIRVEPSDGSSQQVRLDRRIELARPIDPDDIVVAYDEPALSVVVFDGVKRMCSA
jgi:HSP20 family molecular chaperone IbpA